jgi:hypothetical protein
MLALIISTTVNIIRSLYPKVLTMMNVNIVVLRNEAMQFVR